MNLNFLQGDSVFEGSRIDNLYVVFEDSQTGVIYKPELPFSKEVLYPTEIPGVRTVSVHEKNIQDLISGGWQTVTARFGFFGPNPSVQHRLHIFMKQELHSEPVRVAVDDIEIHQLKQCIMPATRRLHPLGAGTG